MAKADSIFITPNSLKKNILMNVPCGGKRNKKTTPILILRHHDIAPFTAKKIFRRLKELEERHYIGELEFCAF